MSRPEELRRGWYTAALTEKRDETPSDWVWVKRQNLESYLNPKNLYEFVKRYRLSTIIDEDDDDDRTPFRLGFSFRQRL